MCANTALCLVFSIYSLIPCYHKITVVSRLKCVQNAIIRVKVSSLNNKRTFLNRWLKTKIYKILSCLKKCFNETINNTGINVRMVPTAAMSG